MVPIAHQGVKKSKLEALGREDWKGETGVSHPGTAELGTCLAPLQL